MQRRLRLRAGGDGQLGVLRQPDPESARELVDALRAGKPAAPTRGAPLCAFRETARILAGLPDQRPDQGQGGAGAATLAGLRVAQGTRHGGAASPTSAEGQ